MSKRRALAVAVVTIAALAALIVFSPGASHDRPEHAASVHRAAGIVLAPGHNVICVAITGEDICLPDVRHSPIPFAKGTPVIAYWTHRGFIDLEVRES